MKETAMYQTIRQFALMVTGLGLASLANLAIAQAPATALANLDKLKQM